MIRQMYPNNGCRSTSLAWPGAVIEIHHSSVTAAKKPRQIAMMHTAMGAILIMRQFDLWYPELLQVHHVSDRLYHHHHSHPQVRPFIKIVWNMDVAHNIDRAVVHERHTLNLA